MPVTPLRTPPLDQAGGILVWRYKLADTLVHIQRLHICTFDAATLNYNATARQTTPTEATVDDTINAWLALVHPYFDLAWDIRCTRLYQVTAGVATRVPLTTAHFHEGTGTTETTGISGVTRESLEFATAGGGSARITFEGAGGVVPAPDDFVTDAAGGSALDNAVVAYLASAASAVRGHDGTKLVAPAHLTTYLVMRDRAKGQRIS